jgi:dienelactone hydrolase
MVEVVLFHHVQGLTEGVAAFADELRRAGHTVHTPDLFEGQTFDSIEAGLAHVKTLGFEKVTELAVHEADRLSAELVYGGFSMGVGPAQMLAQTRPGARGALLFHSCFPADHFGPWPEGVPVQVHGMEGDPFFVEDGDIEAARALTEGVDDAELFLYPGDQHLFADSSLPSYDAGATVLMTRRVLAFLDSL